MHWPVPVDVLRPHVPAGLQLDTFDGTAWLGVVPFLMDIRPRCTPPFPWLTRFLELNVRTYVTDGHKPGVWFFSLDAENALAVAMARAWFGLPYFRARMALQRQGDWIDYRSTRTHRGAPVAEFAARYRPTGEPRHARPGTLDHFLTERYCLYAAARGQLARGEIHHPPWPLQAAECEIQRLEMTRLLGWQSPPSPPLAHFAQSLDVVAWPNRRV